MSSNPFIIPPHPDNTPSPPRSPSIRVLSSPAPETKESPYMIRPAYSTSSPTNKMSATTTAHTTTSTTTSTSAYEINYSPKHSRKPASLTNRNMKNLSLNFSYRASTSPSSNYTTTLLLPAKDLPFNKPLLPRRKTLTLSIPSTNQITTVLQAPKDDAAAENTLVTPSVTKTPLLPPYIPKNRRRTATSSLDLASPQEPTFRVQTLSHTPRLSSSENDVRSHTLRGSDYSYYDYSESATPKTSYSSEYFQEDLINDLQSPMKYSDSFSQISPQSIRLNPNIPSPSDLNHVIHPSIHPHQNLRHPQQISSQRFLIPEELQESNQVNAYPSGPRNVLNNTIFLYLDPALKPKPIDINDFDLVINVAKECQDLSSEFKNQLPGSKEYLYIPWSHTSSISRDLPLLTSKIKHFNDKGLKILVHCQCGISRSACVIVAFFMQEFNIGVNEAYELLKSGTIDSLVSVNQSIGQEGNKIEACDRICPNMSLIFELMEFGDHLTNK